MGYSPHEMAGLLIGYGDDHHLFAVMNDPCKDGLCLLLMVTTIRGHRRQDNTCVLNAGDHTFIKHPSYIAYRIANLSRGDHIGSMVDKHLYIKKDDWDPVVFNKIANGIYVSEDTTLGVIKYARKNGI